MRRNFVEIIIALAFCASIAMADEPRLTVEQFPDMIVVYVHDLDILRARHADLIALVRLGNETRQHRIDLSAQYQTPAMMLSKARREPYDSINIRILAGREQLLSADMPAGPVLKAETLVPLTDGRAHIVKGAAVNAPPVTEIIQPDIAAITAVKLPEADRRLNLDDLAYKVVSDVNFPLISANYYCALTRQTAHPEDPSRLSIYVPLKSQLYNRETGAAGIVMHYLAEIPIDPSWLKAPEDIRLRPEDVKLHTTSTRWPDPQRGRFITGQGAGGLAQGGGSLSIDDEGNIYFSATDLPSGIVRFNIARVAWEVPPIDIRGYINRFLPTREELPENFRANGARFDEIYDIYIGGGRIFFTQRRYADYGALHCSGVFSFPLEHWYDAAGFEAGAHFLAGSWPTAERAIYNVWPQRGEASRTIQAGFLSGGDYYMTRYGSAPGGPWRIDLNPDGSARAITVIDAAELNRALQQQVTRKYHPVAAYRAFKWQEYGLLATTRAQLANALGLPPQDEDISINIYYDAISSMRADPARHELLLNNIAGPSLAPCYMAASIPDMPGFILGVGEYGYYLAYLDIAGAAEGTVIKKYLKLGNERMRSNLPVQVGVGPYGWLWWNEGKSRNLIMPGYIGISRMLFSVDGEPLEYHDSRTPSITYKPLDGAPAGGIHRYQYPHHGIDGKIFLTGSHSADRGGTAYSGGLMVFDAVDGVEIKRLAYMSRGGNTSFLRSRIIHDSTGRKRQNLILAGGIPRPEYLQGMPEAERPGNPDAKIFIYDCVEGGEPRDIFGFSLVSLNGSSGVECQVFSRNGRYLLTFQHNTLLTMDMGAFRYIDGLKISGALARFENPHYKFILAPDGRIFFAATEAGSNVLTFYEADVDGMGRIAVEPHLSIRAPSADGFRIWERGVMAFVPDPSGDGSYDLAVGPNSRTNGTTMWIIRDFIAPR